MNSFKIKFGAVSTLATIVAVGSLGCGSNGAFGPATYTRGTDTPNPDTFTGSYSTVSTEFFVALAIISGAGTGIDGLEGESNAGKLVRLFFSGRESAVSGSGSSTSSVATTGTLTTDGATATRANMSTQTSGTYESASAFAQIPSTDTVVIGGRRLVGSSSDPITNTYDASTNKHGTEKNHATHTSSTPTGQVTSLMIDKTSGRSRVFATMDAGNSTAARTGFIKSSTYTTSNAALLSGTQELIEWIASGKAVATLGEWTTAYSLQESSGKSTTFAKIFTNSDGTAMYTVGTAQDSNSKSRIIVLKSTNGGETWTKIDTHPSDTTSKQAFGAGGGISKSGYLYTIGYEYVTSGSTSYLIWITRRSKDGGTTWETVDSYALSSGQTSIPSSFVKLAAGAIAVMGYSVDSSNISHAIVRLSTDDGATWSTLMDYNYVSGKGSSANSGMIDLSGNLYVTVSGTNSSGVPVGLIRKFEFKSN